MSAAAPEPRLGLRGRIGRQLGADLLENIFARLDAKQLAAAELTCRHWQGIIREREMWQSHCMEARTFNIYQEVDMPGRTTLLMPKPADLAVPPAQDCCWRHKFLQAAAARRWVGQDDNWDLESQPLPQLVVRSHMAYCDGLLACAGGKDVVLWDVRNQRAKWTLRHAAVVGAVAVPASHLLLAASGRQVALWRKDSRVRAFTGARSEVRFVGAVDGMVASATLRDGELRLHDLYSGALNAIVRPHSGDARLTAAHLAGSGSRQGSSMVVSTSADGMVALTDTASGITADRFLCGTHGRDAADSVFHIPERQRVVCGWPDGSAAGFDLRNTGQSLWESEPDEERNFLYLPPGAGGVFLALSASASRFMDVRDSATGKPLTLRGVMRERQAPSKSGRKPNSGADAPAQVLCAAAIGGHLAVGTRRGVTKWLLPGFEALHENALSYVGLCGGQVECDNRGNTDDDTG